MRPGMLRHIVNHVRIVTQRNLHNFFVVSAIAAEAAAFLMPELTERNSGNLRRWQRSILPIQAGLRNTANIFNEMCTEIQSFQILVV